ncbi:MAG TPA: hypothetical protein VGJ84_23560 [Polyangiaceae bacterium]
MTFSDSAVSPDPTTLVDAIRPSGAVFRRAGFGLVLVTLTLGVLIARVVVDGQEQLRLSDAAFNRGDLRAALSHARGAAVAYVPGAVHVRVAFERLLAIARGAEASKDFAVAQAAWRAVRGAVLESRSLWPDHLQELERANRALAQLQPAETENLAGGRPRAEESALQGLKQDFSPRPAWAAAAFSGFAIFAISVVVGVANAVNRTWVGRLKMSLLPVAGAICWALAVYWA